MDITTGSRANAPQEPPHSDLARVEEKFRRAEEHVAQVKSESEGFPSRVAAHSVANAPTAFAYRPARNPMQSGPRPRKWVLELEPRRPLRVEPLMGWTSGDDPFRHIRLEFPTRDAAVRFGKAQGWRVHVLPANQRKPVRKSYRDQFAFKTPPSIEATRSQVNRTDEASNFSEEKASCPSGPFRSKQAVGLDPLDEALESTFPASDPLPLWSGRIGPPARADGKAA